MSDIVVRVEEIRRGHEARGYYQYVIQEQTNLKYLAANGGFRADGPYSPETLTFGSKEDAEKHAAANAWIVENPAAA